MMIDVLGFRVGHLKQICRRLGRGQTIDQHSICLDQIKIEIVKSATQRVSVEVVFRKLSDDQVSVR